MHQFTKVEMFGIARGEAAASDELLDVFVGLQRRLFDGLGLHYQVLDMPAHELGAPAYRKFDVEAWMAGRGLYGEISSASNCTDYQVRSYPKIESNSTKSNPMQLFFFFFFFFCLESIFTQYDWVYDEVLLGFTGFLPGFLGFFQGFELT